MAAAIPRDEMALDRLQAIERFIRSIHTPNLPDARLTAVQRRRLGHMLRCLDGREEQASHLEVATALFGRRLVNAADWHDPAFYQTQPRARRAEDGRARLSPIAARAKAPSLTSPAGRAAQFLTPFSSRRLLSIMKRMAVCASCPPFNSRANRELGIINDRAGMPRNHHIAASCSISFMS
ncbi:MULTISPECIES: DUF2285 domain-containing protein [unclassified Mesorhizobium]|uniref:DUF2285 domain-containing protein n=1 Tax=unclassified Mesorhizobium TaxID=325217 RepID=UPI001F287D08|nr:MULTISPECIES: DUF2285 domain-containing protein [Mesorhizobium]